MQFVIVYGRSKKEFIEISAEGLRISHSRRRDVRGLKNLHHKGEGVANT